MHTPEAATLTFLREILRTRNCFQKQIQEGENKKNQVKETRQNKRQRKVRVYENDFYYNKISENIQERNGIVACRNDTLGRSHRCSNQ